MDVTKKPKHINVTHKKVASFISEYTCPSCGVRFVGAGIKQNVLRFKCECNQELIVDKHLTTAST